MLCSRPCGKERLWVFAGNAGGFPETGFAEVCGCLRIEPTPLPRRRLERSGWCGRTLSRVLLQAVLEGADLIWFAERRRFLCDPFAQDHARRTPASQTTLKAPLIVTLAPSNYLAWRGVMETTLYCRFPLSIVAESSRNRPTEATG